MGETTKTAVCYVFIMAALHFAMVRGLGAKEEGETVTKCLATCNPTGYIDPHHEMDTVIPLRFLGLFVFLLCLKPAFGAAETMVLAVAPGGYPPFLIAVPGKPVVGIMADVLREIATAQGLRLKFVETPQMRVETPILDRQVDAVPRAKEWVSQPDRFLFTDSVLRLRDVIFSRAKHPVLFRKPDDLIGKTVGTHLGYRYPLLEPLFRSKRAYREDAEPATR